jgi:hypothetical protein
MYHEPCCVKTTKHEITKPIKHKKCGGMEAESQGRLGWGTSSGCDPCNFTDQFGMKEEETRHGTHPRCCRACDAAVAATPPRHRW